MKVPASLIVFAILLVCALARLPAAQEAPLRYHIPPVINGGGAVYLLAEKGELEVEISKQDLNFADKYQNNVYAYLLAPDRRLIAKAHLVDEGRAADSTPGSVDTIRLKANVEEPGVYLLLVQLTGFDGKQNDLVWGFSTNARGYMVCRVEASGGSGKGKTPIRLINQSAQDLEFFFQPTLAKTRFEVRGLLDSQGSIVVERPNGKTPLEVPVTPEPSKGTSFTVAPENEEVWGIRLGTLSLVLTIEGVTHWKTWGGFGYEDHGFWTFHKDAFFPMPTHRWSLTPYLVVEPLARKQSRGEASLAVYNHSKTNVRQFHLEAVSPSGSVVQLSGLPKEVSVAPGEKLPLLIPFEVRPGKELAAPEEHRIRIRDRNRSDYFTYSTIRFSPPLKKGPLNLPLVYEPFSHIAEQLDYRPGYPMNQVDFDLQNRPCVRQAISRHETEGIFVRENGEWKLKSFVDSLRNAIPKFERTERGSTFFSTRTGFDGEGGVYTTISASEHEKAGRSVRVLLYKPEQGAEFQAYPLDEAGRAVVDIEGFSGHNASNGPPPVVLYSYNEGSDEEGGGRFKVPSTLSLIIPEKRADKTLSLGKRVVLSHSAIYLCTHSGGANTVVSRGDKIYVIYGEVVDAKAEAVPGVPTYIVAYDRSNGKLEGPVLLGYAPPLNDMHNSSGIVIDEAGILHVLLGAHGQKPFQYTHSLKANSISDGWSKPEVVCSTGIRFPGKKRNEVGAQTYVGLVCGKDGTLYSAFRQDLQDPRGHFPDFGERYRVLSVQRKKPGQPWELPVPIVIPPLPGYSVYYHKLTVDRSGRLFLYYTYRSGNSIYRSEMPNTGDYSALLVSDDDAETWRVATEGDFQ